MSVLPAMPFPHRGMSLAEHEQRVNVPDASGRNWNSIRNTLLHGGVSIGIKARSLYSRLLLKHPGHPEEETHQQWSAPAAPHILPGRWDSERHIPTPLAWHFDNAYWCDGG